MRILGIVGGLGPESTIDYYRSIIAGVRTRKSDAGYPHIVINSLDPDKVLATLDAGRPDELANYIASGVDLVVRAGAQFGFIAANTPHLVFDEVQRRSPIPLISIVLATVDQAKSLGLKKVGLLGTGFTMRASFYADEFRRAGITMVVPGEADRQFIHQKYVGELLKNKFLPDTRAAILNIAERMKDENAVEAIVLAGTELPLILRDSATDLKFLDTTVIHVEAIVNELLALP